MKGKGGRNYYEPRAILVAQMHSGLNVDLPSWYRLIYKREH